VQCLLFVIDTILVSCIAILIRVVNNNVLYILVTLEKQIGSVIRNGSFD
jgi:hypothetical protein